MDLMQVQTRRAGSQAAGRCKKESNICTVLFTVKQVLDFLFHCKDRVECSNGTFSCGGR